MRTKLTFEQKMYLKSIEPGVNMQRKITKAEMKKLIRMYRPGYDTRLCYRDCEIICNSIFNQIADKLYI